MNATEDTAACRDDLDPQEIPAKASELLLDKVRLKLAPMGTLAVLAGAYVAFGSVFFLVVLAAPDGAVPHGILQLLAGTAFSLGLILVVVAGAELFTGNTLMATLWLQQTSTWHAIGRAWMVVYVGNLVGSLAIVALFLAAGGHLAGGGRVGIAALEVAEQKTALAFHEALASGVLANILVCLAVWLSFSARTTPGKILAVVPPIAAFVAAGFEHSVANMSLIPAGLGLKWLASAEFWSVAGASAADFPTLSFHWMVWNLLWATIGNVIGGALVGLAYWHAYGD